MPGENGAPPIWQPPPLAEPGRPQIDSVGSTTSQAVLCGQSARVSQVWVQ